jgi:pimeloyl-ACP methyl ester carboxylesterase
VRGTDSEIVSRPALDEFRVAAPHAEIGEIAGAHHHVLLDQPRALAEVIRAFCARLPAG